MRHANLGRTGLPVTRLCLGTMTFGLQCDEEQSRALLDAAADAGITFLATADVDPLGGSLERVGRTEEIVGRWLRGRSDQFVVATKCVRSDGAESVGPGHAGSCGSSRCSPATTCSSARSSGSCCRCVPRRRSA